MCHQVSCEVDPAVSSLAKHVEQLIPLTEDSWHLTHDINVLLIGIDVVGRIGGACRILGTVGPTSLIHQHLPANDCRITIASRAQVGGTVHIGIDGVVFLLFVLNCEIIG